MNKLYQVENKLIFTFEVDEKFYYTQTGQYSPRSKKDMKLIAPNSALYLYAQRNRVGFYEDDVVQILDATPLTEGTLLKVVSLVNKNEYTIPLRLFRPYYLPVSKEEISKMSYAQLGIIISEWKDKHLKVEMGKHLTALFTGLATLDGTTIEGYFSLLMEEGQQIEVVCNCALDDYEYEIFGEDNLC